MSRTPNEIFAEITEANDAASAVVLGDAPDWVAAYAERTERLAELWAELADVVWVSADNFPLWALYAVSRTRLDAEREASTNRARATRAAERTAQAEVTS